MNRFLTTEQRADLVAQHRNERDRKRGDRLKAVLWSDEGLTQEQIAALLFVHINTVAEHLSVFKEESRLDPNHKGAKSILNEEEALKLERELESKIYTKAKDIQAYIKDAFKKDMALSSLHEWLKKRGFSYKKPRLVPKNADPEKQQAFIRAYEALMAEAELHNEPVLFGDAVHPTQQVQEAYGWIRKGTDKLIETTGARKRVNVMGAIDLETMKFNYKDFETINGAAAIAFLKEIERSYPKASRIHLIWDQAGYHTCKEVSDYLEKSRIKVHYLPPRSPNLNPIERLWKIMHEHVSHNRVYDKFRDFKAALFAFFDHTIPNINDVLISRITDRFQVLKTG